AAFLAVAACAAPLTREQREASLRFVASLQNPDGGYRPAAPAGKSQLGTAPAVLRVAKYFEGRLPNRDATLKFILDCYDPATGGFADTPGAAPDVRSTAMGVMALADIQAPRGILQERLRSASTYFDKNAKSLPEIYIGTAALNAAGAKSPSAARWIAAFEETRTPEGIYGKGGPETARAVNTILRLDGELKDPQAAARDLKAAQRPDGGFSASGGASDLPTTYPMMRALFMLKEKPDLAKLRQFVASCRNADGGYGPQPGQPSTAGATYNAAIVLHWADEMGR
ncbi:MAG TPA: prenyltransferase/squalene oxidase repeat-containing protein, partial [Armatimonadota bacterium]|nr:prenyltransferase/squalene oxidase repeat-containing protein [Armatimonadota bacterium]